MDSQLEFGVVPGPNDFDLNVVSVIHDASSHVNHQVAKLEVGIVGLARGRALAGRLDGYVSASSDDSRSPASRNIVTHRPDKRSVGRAELSLWTTRALAERAAPTSQISITAVF